MSQSLLRLHNTFRKFGLDEVQLASVFGGERVHNLKGMPDLQGLTRKSVLTYALNVECEVGRRRQEWREH